MLSFIRNLLLPLHKRPAPVLMGNQAKGRYGERVAASYLRSLGYKILTRNYRSRKGEIDLVCRDGKTLVFIEVKTRSDHATERPARAVGKDQKRRIIRAAHAYVSGLSVGRPPVRFDIVEVKLPDQGTPECGVIRGAFYFSH